jgi:hypothetical protein
MEQKCAVSKHHGGMMMKIRQLKWLLNLEAAGLKTLESLMKNHSRSEHPYVISSLLVS